MLRLQELEQSESHSRSNGSFLDFISGRGFAKGGRKIIEHNDSYDIFSVTDSNSEGLVSKFRQSLT